MMPYTQGTYSFATDRYPLKGSAVIVIASRTYHWMGVRFVLHKYDGLLETPFGRLLQALNVIIMIFLEKSMDELPEP